MQAEIRHDFKPDWGMLGWTATLYVDGTRVSTGVGMDREEAIQNLARHVEPAFLKLAREQSYDHLLPAHEKAVKRWGEELERREVQKAQRSRR